MATHRGTDREANQGYGLPERWSQAPVHPGTAWLLKENASPAKGGAGLVCVWEVVEGTGDAPSHATNELNLKHVLVNNDQFCYFFFVLYLRDSFAEANTNSPYGN